MKRRGLALVVWLMLPGAAFAQPFPAAFMVKDVAAEDVLNIRAAPSAEAQAIGQIAPFALHVEVLETTSDGTWGMVGLPEGNGWVSMRYLHPMPAEDEAQVPRPLSCMGTEPFWSIGLYPQGAEFNSPDTGAVPMAVVAEAAAPQGYLVTLEEGPTLQRTLVVSREACSDGMSDRRFGFSLRMFKAAPDGNQVLSGCCTLDHR
jgi:uncharacterized membrane protein